MVEGFDVQVCLTQLADYVWICQVDYDFLLICIKSKDKTGILLTVKIRAFLTNTAQPLTSVVWNGDFRRPQYQHTVLAVDFLKVPNFGKGSWIQNIQPKERYVSCFYCQF